jgi:catabolite regulation protein CreA
MKYKNKFLPTFLTAVTLTFLFACGQNNSNKNISQADNLTTDNQVLTIDTFSTFPPEIDGCSCYFSNDSTEFIKGEYIYMNDYAQTSFLKINGVLTKFAQTDFKEIDSLNVIAKYKSDKYQMTIESKDGIQNGDETWLKTGTIKLTDKNGKTIKKTFYGECGC